MRFWKLVYNFLHAFFDVTAKEHNSKHTAEGIQIISLVNVSSNKLRILTIFSYALQYSGNKQYMNTWSWKTFRALLK
jgi:hypothetical protein